MREGHPRDFGDLYEDAQIAVALQMSLGLNDNTTVKCSEQNPCSACICLQNHSDKYVY